MLDERNNRLLLQLQACADNRTPVSSGSFATPAADRSDRAANAERYCGLAMLLQARLVSRW